MRTRRRRPAPGVPQCATWRALDPIDDKLSRCLTAAVGESSPGLVEADCKTAVVEGSRFAVLDVVEIGDGPVLAEQGLSGQRGVVTEIRRYDDGHYAYGVGAFEDGSDVGGLYPEECLTATGERASPDLFRIPGPFQTREVVQIAEDCEVREAAGRRAVLTDAYSEDPDTGELRLCVWIDELGTVVTIAPKELQSTGQRESPKPRGRVAHSTAVGTDGEIHGTSSFVIVDEIDHYV